jgi:hypothetical protein
VDAACRGVRDILTTFEGRLARYQSLERRLLAASGDTGQPVELNVGGTRFHTTVGTLCQEPSYLQGMFSGYVTMMLLGSSTNHSTISYPAFVSRACFF